MRKLYLLIVILLTLTSNLFSQIEEDELGGWYMLFYSTTFNESPFGIQGDIQYRNWNVIGDLEQLLLRSGITYSPRNMPAKFTLGYGYILNSAFGNNDNNSQESRIYQEALLPHSLTDRLKLTHRFRYEQRFVDEQDFRTRFRYNLFINIALNKPSFEKGTVYLALYNEIFINGQRKVTSTRSTELFDRNRLYAAIGYHVGAKNKVQVGFLNQHTDNWNKNQLQLSFHTSF